MYLSLVFVLLMQVQGIQEDECYTGVVTACINSAKAYEKERKFAEALKLLDAACMLDDPYSCIKLSVIYSKKMWDEAKKLDEKTRIKLSLAYSKRAYELLKDSEKIYKIMCEEFEIASSCLALASIYKEKGEKNNSKELIEKSQKLLEKSFQKAKSSCDSGDENSCYLIGFMYYHGYFVGKDEEKAIEIIDRACENGSGGACFFISGIYRNKDKKKYIKYLKRACDKLNVNACYELWKETKDKRYLSSACDIMFTPQCEELFRK